MACHIIFYADKLPFLLHLLLSENIFLPSLGRRASGQAGQWSCCSKEIWKRAKKGQAKTVTYTHTYVYILHIDIRRKESKECN